MNRAVLICKLAKYPNIYSNSHIYIAGLKEKGKLIVIKADADWGRCPTRKRETLQQILN